MNDIEMNNAIFLDFTIAVMTAPTIPQARMTQTSSPNSMRCEFITNNVRNGNDRKNGS